jgi:hypothetical protein
VTDRVQRYSRLYGTIGTRWPARLLDARSALIWTLGKAKPVQRRIQFAAGYFPALDIELPASAAAAIPARKAG